ncbi:MAG: FadR family transcriptional regulator [Paenarthrobacter ureafaciens]|uniref:FadR/GntR family transcriptional regulator n=1 Tax=Paenarthrobacter ureafaciens TaxID=37931 RepID=UPI001AC81408|nr:FadR/GntR family transcriptional regulator [Paenarthrobacter ureafaciens]MBN9129180.1 FadR family transcriptional regulator [Paenarthrobacter ureafaciens]
MATSTEDLFLPVNVDRASQVIVDQIKVLIRSGKLQPGDRLPSERELCQRFNVSRVTVREALRVLETNGLLTIRVGSHGGAFLTTPSAERLGVGLADLLSLAPATAHDVTEARFIVELGTLPLAVERATEEDIAALFAMVEEAEAALKAGKYNVELSAAFHTRIAQCTHNPAVEMLMQSFNGPLRMSLEESHTAAPMGEQGIAEHRKLAEAIQARDVEGARKLMTEHLNRTAARVLPNS